MNLRVVFSEISFHEWVIGNSECQSVQAFELKFIVRVESVSDWVLGVFLFFLDGLNVLIKLISLVLFEFFQLAWALHHHYEFAGEGRNLNFLTRVENEMHDTAVSAFNQTRLFSTDLL